MGNASEAVYFLTYNGQGMAELKGAGLFSTGTSVYVTEDIANLAKASGGAWTIVPPGKAPAPAAAAAPAAPKAEEKKHEEKKAEAPKAPEKKAEAPKPAAEEKKAEEAPKAEAAKT